MNKLKVVKNTKRRGRVVRIDVSLNELTRDKLEAYLNEIGSSIEAFTRRLILKELAEETILYENHKGN